MRQFRSTVFVLAIFMVFILSGCGGGSAPNQPSLLFISPPDDVSVTPYAIVNTNDASGNAIHFAGSVNYGDLLVLGATVFGTGGTNVTDATVAWSSSNNTLATVSSTLPAGFSCASYQGCTVLCAGTWDSANIDCIPPPSGTPGGRVTITAQSGAASEAVTIYVHPKIDKIVVSQAGGGCVSLGGTAQLSATVYSGTTVLPSSGPSDVVGPIYWQATTGGVAAFGKASANGVITTTAPGTTTVVAAIPSQLAARQGTPPIVSISSSPLTFITCPVSSIHLYVSSTSGTSTSLAPSGTSQLSADVFDSNGTLLKNPPLSYFSEQPAVATVSSTGLVAATAAGTSPVIAACSGNTCNIGMPPVYSNVVTATVTGNTSTTVYVAANGGTSLVPIATGGNAAGTAVTLPNAANSIVFDASGTTAFIGSPAGIMAFLPATGAVGVLSGTPIGEVLGVSPNGQELVAYNSANKTVQIINVSTLAAPTTSASFAVSVPPRVAFSPDSLKTYIVSGNVLYSFTSASNPLVPITLTGAANDVSFLPQASFAYLAGGAPGAITARASCDNSQADSKTVPGAATLISTTPDGTRVVAADSPGLDLISVSTTNVGCPPPLTDSNPTSVDYGLGAFTAEQLVVLPNSSKAYVVTNLAQLLAYDLSANTPSAITLAGGATPLNEGATLDSSTLYVGGNDNAVHVIDTSTGADTAQISVSFTPSLLAVRP